jgi:hypothetical protein
METNDPLYTEAVEFAAARVGFTRDRFQRVLRVGFVKRDQLLLLLEDNGVVKRASNDRNYFLTVGA